MDTPQDGQYGIAYLDVEQSKRSNVTRSVRLSFLPNCISHIELVTIPKVYEDAYLSYWSQLI